MSTDRVEALTRRVLRAVRRGNSRSRGHRHGALKELLLGVLEEKTSRRHALVMLNRLERTFVDWNEVRISSLYEIAHTMDGSARALQWAERVREVLRRVFDTTNDLTLETLAGLSHDKAKKMIREFAALPDHEREDAGRRPAPKRADSSAERPAPNRKEKG